MIDDEKYPLSTAQDVSSTLAGSKVFTKLDLAHAYVQKSVDEASRKYLCINTHKGTVCFYKVTLRRQSAPKMFQVTTDKILQGVESSPRPVLTPNQNRSTTEEQGCILWRIRVIVPVSQMMSELRWEQTGVCIRAVARGFMWWPGLDGEIESAVKGCAVCQNVRSLPPRVPLHPWKWPVRPFQRVHIDFFQKGNDHFCLMVCMSYHEV